MGTRPVGSKRRLVRCLSPAASTWWTASHWLRKSSSSLFPRSTLLLLRRRMPSPIGQDSLLLLPRVFVLPKLYLLFFSMTFDLTYLLLYSLLHLSIGGGACGRFGSTPLEKLRKQGGAEPGMCAHLFQILWFPRERLISISPHSMSCECGCVSLWCSGRRQKEGQEEEEEVACRAHAFHIHSPSRHYCMIAGFPLDSSDCTSLNMLVVIAIVIVIINLAQLTQSKHPSLSFSLTHCEVIMYVQGRWTINKPSEFKTLNRQPISTRSWIQNSLNRHHFTGIDIPSHKIANSFILRRRTKPVCHNHMIRCCTSPLQIAASVANNIPINRAILKDNARSHQTNIEYNLLIIRFVISSRHTHCNCSLWCYLTSMMIAAPW